MACNSCNSKKGNSSKKASPPRPSRQTTVIIPKSSQSPRTNYRDRR